MRVGRPKKDEASVVASRGRFVGGTCARAAGTIFETRNPELVPLSSDVAVCSGVTSIARPPHTRTCPVRPGRRGFSLRPVNPRLRLVNIFQAAEGRLPDFP